MRHRVALNVWAERPGGKTPCYYRRQSRLEIPTVFKKVAQKARSYSSTLLAAVFSNGYLHDKRFSYLVLFRSAHSLSINDISSTSFRKSCRRKSSASIRFANSQSDAIAQVKSDTIQNNSSFVSLVFLRSNSLPLSVTTQCNSIPSCSTWGLPSCCGVVANRICLLGAFKIRAIL